MNDRAGLSLRRAGPADAEAIGDLVRAAYAKWVPLIGREPLPMQADYGTAVREHEIDLLFSGPDLVGLIETIAHPDHLWIENVAVAPASHGQGLGRHLLAHAERRAAAAGLAQARLLTNLAFDGNVALYQSLGYEIERAEPFRGGTTVYMAKPLSIA